MCARKPYGRREVNWGPINDDYSRVFGRMKANDHNTNVIVIAMASDEHENVHCRDAAGNLVYRNGKPVIIGEPTGRLKPDGNKRMPVWTNIRVETAASGVDGKKYSATIRKTWVPGSLGVSLENELATFPMAMSMCSGRPVEDWGK